MIGKYLVVGVGGSGGKTIRFMWREMALRLRARGWTGPVPDNFRYIHFDLPPETDAVRDNVPPELEGAGKYLGLADTVAGYDVYDARWLNSPPMLSSFANWRPDPDSVRVHPADGAGQRRAVGRVVAATELDKVGQAIDDQARLLEGPTGSDAMRELNRAIGAKGNKQSDPQLIVISSLAGGTGSGMFLDVMEVISSHADDHPWFSYRLTPIVFTPDVFSKLPPGAQSGVQGNSLAAVSELMNLYENEGPTPGTDAAILKMGGGTETGGGSRIDSSVIFVSSKNQAKVDFETQNEVYRSIGKGLAALLTDDRRGSEFIADLCNTSDMAVEERFRLTNTAEVGRPAVGFGYASVSLGRTRFVEYAAQRLAKRAVTRLEEGWAEGRPSSDRRTLEAVSKEIVDGAGNDFMTSTGLWEYTNSKGEAVSQIYRSLVAAVKPKVDTGIAGALSEVTKRIVGNRTRIAIADLKDGVASTAFDSEAATFNKQIENELQAAVQAWVPAAQAKFETAVGDAVSAYGLDIAIALLDKLSAETDDTISDLMSDSNKKAKASRRLVDDAESFVSTLKGKFIGESDPGFSQSNQKRRLSLQHGAEASAAAAALELHRDAKRNLIAPMRVALEAAKTQLDADLNGEFAKVVDGWSSREVPETLMPAMNEMLLTPVADFPHEMDSLLNAMFAVETGDGSVVSDVEGAESTALQEVLTGSWRKQKAAAEEPGGGLIEGIARWIPEKSEFRPVGGDGKNKPREQRARFALNVRPLQLQARALKWVWERPGGFSDYAKENLKDWLDPNEPNVGTRAEQFANLLSDAIDRAVPLLTIDTKAYELIHGSQKPSVMFKVSTIPFNPKDPAALSVVEKLKDYNVDVGTTLDPGAEVSDVEVYGKYGEGMSPFVLGSLVNPIQGEFQKRATQHQRGQFWSNRRARPLPTFTPLAPSKQAALARGWITAIALGQFDDVITGRWSDAPRTIWTPSGEKAFSRQLLDETAIDEKHLFATLLLSLPLAMVEFATVTQDPVDAYTRLLDLGTQGSGGGQWVPGYERLSDPLSMWIDLGKTEDPLPSYSPAPVPNPNFAGTPEMTPLERRAAVSDFVSKQYAPFFAEDVAQRQLTKDTTRTIGLGWEVRDLIAAAAADLTSALDNHSASVENGKRSPAYARVRG